MTPSGIRELYRGDIRPTVIVGSLPPPGGPLASSHETRLLFEHHFVGRDAGKPGITPSRPSGRWPTA